MESKYNAIEKVAKELGGVRFHDAMGGGYGNASLDPPRVIQIIFGGNLAAIETALQAESQTAEKELWKRNKK